MTSPSPQDIANAAARQEIAARLNDEYGRVLRWAIGKFGPGYYPTGRYDLVDKEEEDRSRRDGTPAVHAATMFTVRHAETGAKRHFVVEEGTVREVANYQDAFGAMLEEPHPRMRIEMKGEKVAPHRYSLCWASIETYTPRSAESLAAAREKREAKAVERAAEESPLFADQIRSGELKVGKKGRGRTPG